MKKISKKTTIYDYTPEAFHLWLTTYEPVIKNARGKLEPWKPTKLQIALIKEILQPKIQVALYIAPRRHGKSTVFMMIALWLFSTLDNFNIQCLGTDEAHSRRTQFDRMKTTIFNSPKLADLIGGTLGINDKSIGKLDFDGMKEMEGRSKKYLSEIFPCTGVSKYSGFGHQVDLLWVSDAHSFDEIGRACFNNWLSSLMDSQKSIILIDSNPDAHGGFVHQMQLEAETKPQWYAYQHEYRDFQHFRTDAPDWIDRKKAEGLEATLLPDEFERDVLGKRTSAENALFSTEIIEQIQHDYQIPMSKGDFEKMTHGKSFSVGIGLDKARNLVKSKTGDDSVLCTTVKIQNPGKEPLFVLLNTQNFPLNTDEIIINAIIQDYQRYNATNVCLENFDVNNIFLKLSARQIPTELINATQSVKYSSIPLLYRAANEKRLHIPRSAVKLIREMQSYIHVKASNGTYKFRHGTGQDDHDDFIDALNWSIWATREHVTSEFVLDAISCTNRFSGRKHCYLLGADHVVHSCCDRCPAHLQTVQFHQQYLLENPEESISLVDFFRTLVKADFSNYRL